MVYLAKPQESSALGRVHDVGRYEMVLMAPEAATGTLCRSRGGG